MYEFFQTLQEEYYTTAGWQPREAYPWEYDKKIEELIRHANDTNSWSDLEGDEWLRQQARIFQKRAEYIRQAWAREQATKEFNQRLATINATLQAMQQSTQQITQLATQQSTPPAPQEAHKDEANDKENAEITAEKQAPLYQATVEDITESTMESTTKDDNSMAVSKSTLSTFPRLCTTRSSGDSAACLSNARLLACQYTMFLAWHGLLPGYIEYSEGMEATGQG